MWLFVGHHYRSRSFLITSVFFAACLLGRVSPAGSSCSSSSMVLFTFSTSNGTKSCMGLLIVHILLVFSWYTNNSTPRILLSRLSKNFVTFPFRHNNFDLFSSLMRTTSPIFKFTFPLLGSYLFWFECLSNNANKYPLVNRLVKHFCVSLSVVIRYLNPHLLSLP